MTSAGTIFALDLGTRLGYAAGLPGERPRSGAILLKQKGEARGVALSNLIAWLNEQWSAERPALVVKEAALPLQAFRDRGNSEAGVLMAHGLHAIVEAMSIRFGLRLEEAHPATVRKHFVGKGRLGERAQTKAAVVQRCQTLSYIPRACTDEDRADALALFDYASATWARRPMSKLFLFGETARSA